MPSENQQILEAFVNAFAEGVEKQCEYLTDDAVFLEAESLPFPGGYVGHEGFGKLVGLMGKYFEMELHDLEYIDGGEKVVAIIPIRWTSKRSGEQVDMTLVEIYSFRDGKISGADIYYKEPERIGALA